MSEEGNAPREEGLVRGANGDGPVRVGKNEALAFAALAKAYLEGGRKPIGVKKCQEIVSSFTTQPDLMLHNLELHGLVSADAARGRNRSRIVFVDKTVVAKDGEEERQMWPETAVADAAPMPAVPPAVEALPPAKSRVLTLDETRVFLNERFVGVEFTVSEVVRATGMSQGTTYDRIRPLVESGEIVQVGGTKGKKNDPARFRLGSAVVASSPVDDPPTERAVSRAIKSEAELAAELAAVDAEIEAAEEAARTRRVERIRAAEAEVVDLEVRLDQARSRVRDETAVEPKAEGVEAIRERRERLRQLTANYDLLFKDS